MANIVGEPFDPFVSKQILDRQKIHGSAQRTNSVLSYLNSKTSYIKLTSGVRVIEYERLTRIDLGGHPSFSDTGLAERFVLFNGTSDKGNTLFGGINGIDPLEFNQDIGQSILNQHAYGLGGNEFGIRPMPGVKSCDIKSRNRGSIREANIQIKVWNRNQFEVINLLYLRLGFPMLLEWGHTIIIDVNGNINPNPNFSLSSDFLSKKYKTDNDVLKAIESQRKASAGNYDAMYGKVVNFDWSFNKDGSYDVNLKLISIGAVIESLKINCYLKDLSSNSPINTDTDENPESDEEWIDKFKFSHSIGYIFWSAMYLLNDWRIGVNDIFEFDRIDGINKSELKSFLRLPQDFEVDKEFIKSQNETINNYINSLNTPSTDKDYILYGLKGFNELFYIRFGEFLRLLQLLIPINKETTPPTPILNIDTTSVFMYTTPKQISGNPKICLVGGFDIPDDSSTINFLNTPETLSTNSFKSIINNKIIHGNINNIYVNMAFILQNLENFKDENGKVTILDLLKSILDGINEALGSVNTLECVITNDNVIKIIDGTPIPGFASAFPPDPDSESAQFDIYGYYKINTPDQSAGFVKDFQLKTEITNNLAAMITIGATANGHIVGEDATAFSKWSKGLAPIINENIAAATGEDKKPSAQEEKDQLIKNNAQLVQDYRDFVSESINFNLSSDLMDSGAQLISNFLAYINELSLIQQKINDAKSTPVSATSSRGFLPINLSLTIDGLSGIKVYQKIKVDTSYLPSDYPSALNFIVKGAAHKIDRNGWVTTIDTVSIPVIDLIEYTGAISPTGAAIISTSSAEKNASRNCGNPVVYQIKSIFNPNINKYSNALNKALQNTFKNGPGEQGKCALYTNSTATSFINILKGKPPGPQFIRGKGNAKDISARNYLRSLGYSVDNWAENINKNEIQKLLNNRKYNIGDIVIYWANDGDPEDSCSKYGHVQIYSGKVWNPYTYKKSQTNFVSSVPDNYTTNPFVYTNKTQNCWNLYLCQAPII